MFNKVQKVQVTQGKLIKEIQLVQKQFRFK